MRNIATFFLAALCVFALFSCDEDGRGEHNVLPQNEQSAVEPIVREDASDTRDAQAATVDEPGTIPQRTWPFEYAYIGAYELRNVMPDSWQRLKRLTEESEELFFAENAELMAVIEGNLWGIHPRNDVEITAWYERVYEERVGYDIFFRIVFTLTDTPQFDEWGHQFVQALVYKGITRNILITMGGYNDLGGGQFYATNIFTSIDIIRSGNKAKGILVTTLEVPFSWNKENEPFYVAVSNAGRSGFYSLERPAGIVRSRYYLMNDIYEDMVVADGMFPFIPSILISASDSLVYPRSPLRFALQNAFDGNTATSYIANTVDGQLSMRLWIVNGDISSPMLGMEKIAIINGNAQNEELYFAYNKIKKMTGYDKVELLDGILGFQFGYIQPCMFGSINVIKLYEGERYNYTAIAEMNIRVDQVGWLFGDMNE